MRNSWKVLVLVVLALAACGKPAAPTPEALNLPMGYVANVQFSPFYVALERGYFTQANYAVTFDYRWETDGMQLVAAGQVPFTIASGDQVIQARSQGLPVVAVAAWFQRFPVAVISLQHELRRPEDLRGLKIGVPATFGASYIGLRALLNAGGLSEDDVEIQEIGYTQLAALNAGTVDAAVVYANNEPVILIQEGTPFSALYVADYANLVSNVLVTNETMTKEHPERVRAFVQAFLQGLQDVLTADALSTLEVCKRYVEGLDQAQNATTQLAVLEATLDYWRTETPGRFDPASWEQAQQVMLEAGLIQQTVPLESLFTNQFVP